MRYSGIECTGCGKPFEENDDVVVCPVCGSPQHRDCWKKQNRCANEEKHGQDFKWRFPEGKDPNLALSERKVRLAGETQIKFKNGEDAVICPSCSALNYGNDAFCARCKKPLNRKPEASRSDPGYEQTSPERLAYDNMRLYGGLEPNILIDGVTVSQLSAYLGGSQPGRIIRRMATMERYERKFSFSPAAFLFGPLWFFYRKLYKAGALLLAALTLCYLLLSFTMLTPENIEFIKDSYPAIQQDATAQIDEEKCQELLDAATARLAQTLDTNTPRAIAAQILQYVRWLLRFGSAFLADGALRRKMKRDISAAREHSEGGGDFTKELNRRGGSSAAGVLIGLLLSGATYIIGALPILLSVLT